MKLFKGKKYKFIHTMDIQLDDVRAVFFPKDFWEKYRYLGHIPFQSEGKYFDAMLPLILLMEYEPSREGGGPLAGVPCERHLEK